MTQTFLLSPRVDLSLVDGVTSFSSGVSNGVESFEYASSQGTGKGFIFQKRSTFDYHIFIEQPDGKWSLHSWFLKDLSQIYVLLKMIISIIMHHIESYYISRWIV